MTYLTFKWFSIVPETYNIETFVFPSFTFAWYGKFIRIINLWESPFKITGHVAVSYIPLIINEDFTQKSISSIFK